MTDENVAKAINALKKEYGDDFQFEEDDEFIFELNNCCLVLALEDNTFKVKYVGNKIIKLDAESEFYGEAERESWD